MSIEPITIPMTMSASEVDIPMDFETEINVHSGGGSNLQAKTNISPTTSSQTITADAGYDGLSSVQINAMPSGSATTPATSITANPSISVDSSTGEITASVSKTQSVTPTVSAGYVASGTAGTVTVSGSNTSNLTTQGAQTIHPSSSDQTIASGKYLTGAQTIKGVTVTNLTAENIKKDVVVEIGDSTDSDCVTSVTGSYEGGGGGTLITKTIDANGTYDAEDDGADGYSSVTVNVSPFSAFQEVEYLSIGSTRAYASIPFPTAVGDVIEASAKSSAWTSRDHNVFIGIKDSFNSSDGFRGYIGILKTTVNNVNVWKTGLWATSGKLYSADDPTIIASASSVFYGDEVSNGDLATVKVGVGTVNVTRHLLYGAYSGSEYFINGNLYALTVKNSSNVKKIDLVPCYRKADNVPGFYDHVSGNFYTAEQGTFTAGPDVVPASLALSMLLGEGE